MFCLVACQNNSTTPALPGGSAQKAATSAPANTEFIELNTLTVNGNHKELLTVQQLESQLGRPDSISKTTFECGGELGTVNGPDSRLWFYGRTTYEVNENQATMSGFDVTSGKFQGKVGKLNLNKNTTLGDVRRFYPMSAKPDTVLYEGRSAEIMSVPLHDKGIELDASLNLLFRNGRLLEVLFGSPC
ncbi:hypothetical protein BEN48_09145 [Hymenobacter glacialis]|uniref:Uncharacterized protein n=1 Tax=Hymenobacter glacialis TaxID=1908236 RepID=A0A1G1TCD9_9BACT|nr:hypothetical protein BEN48_09145 [Hymenobacter glacialis]